MKSIVLILFLSYLTSGSILCSSSSFLQNELDTLKVWSPENQNEPSNNGNVCWRFYLKQENESITDCDVSFLSEQNIYVLDNRISLDVKQLVLDPSKFSDLKDFNAYITYRHSKSPEMVFIILDIESLKLLDYKSTVEYENRQFTQYKRFD